MVLLLLLLLVVPDTISQILPRHFDLIIDQMRQEQRYTPLDINDYVEYNLTPEQMLEHMSLSFSNNATNQCEKDFEIIFLAASKRDMWAMKVIDAWGKPLPSGILTGNLHWVGNYDECLQELYLSNNKSFISQPFNTQYCTLSPLPSSPNATMSLRITLGICVPSSCDRESTASLINTIFKRTDVTKMDLTCSKDPPNGQEGLTHGAIITYIILSLLGFIVLLGTIIDFLLPLQDESIDRKASNINTNNCLTDDGMLVSEQMKLIRHPAFSLHSLIDSTSRITVLAEFSAFRTLRRIFTLKQKNNEDTFTFINGIRVLSLFWVIIGHSMMFSLAYSSNPSTVLVWIRNIFMQLIINGVLSVDTFFALSGFLTAILFVRQVKKEKKLSIRLFILYYVHRYIRLTPTFLLIILVSINLTPYFGQGPMYPREKGFESDECRAGLWWTSVLYVGNLYKPYRMCFGISWYLHNDMQFHWIAPLALVPFVLGRKTISFIMTIVFILTGIISILSILLYYPNLSVNIFDAFGDRPGPSFYKNIYVVPWCRISAYAIGLLTGLLVISFGREYRLNRGIKAFGTIIAILLGLACLFAMYPDYILASGLSRPIVITYQSLSRTLWSMVIGWILFLCSTYQGGLVDKILSWSIWTPLARLNYSCYLVHYIVVHTMVYSQRMPIYFQPHLLVNNFVSHIFFSYVAAIIVTILVETPFFIVEKKLFKR